MLHTVFIGKQKPTCRICVFLETDVVITTGESIFFKYRLIFGEQQPFFPTPVFAVQICEMWNIVVTVRLNQLHADQGCIFQGH